MGLQEIPDGVDIKVELQSNCLYSGFMQKRGEKGLIKSWQKRWFTLIWHETNLAQREIRYSDGRDYCTRKHKGSIDLSQATEVNAVEIEGARGITIRTPGRLWELLPATSEEAAEWMKILTQLMTRKKGLAVVSSMSNMSLNPDVGEQNVNELTVVLTRKLGMSINKVANEIMIADLDADGAAAACGLLSVGDALDEINGVKAETCKQTIQLLLSQPSQAQLKLFSRVIHGGWMHKLGEGLGGWTTRYFTLSYEVDETKGGEKRLSHSDLKKTRQRATSSAAAQDLSSAVVIQIHKAHKHDKLGISLTPADDEGKVRIARMYDGYTASTHGGLAVGDVILQVNGQPITTQGAALHLLSESPAGVVALHIERSQDRGCYVMRYYDGKNAVTRVEKGVIRLDKDSIREINKYTLQDETEDGTVPRIGMYILQDERCWELLPPEEELDAWITKLQLAIFGQVRGGACGVAGSKRGGR